MLSWTAAGAVSHPTTVQIRVERRYPERVRAGAPVPTRSLSPDELQANLRYFTEGLRTPRTRPCTTLVLSGGDLGARPDLPGAVALARALGIERVILHAGLSPLPPGLDVDVLVVPVQPHHTPTARALAGAHQGARLATNTVLRAEDLAHLDAVTALLTRLRPEQATFTYPFPTSPEAVAEAPTPAAAVAALGPAAQALQRAGVPVCVKGLPACQLGGLRSLLRRTSNRWYVDAEHQGRQALMFLPDVAAFHKGDACRFCAADPTCDGFFAEYLARPGFPPLQTLSE